MGLLKKPVLWLALCAVVLTPAAGAPKDCVYKYKAQIIALLALHSGENCDQVVLSGLQQEAALHYVNDHLNSLNPSAPQIDVQVFDTCSSSEQAVNAALRGLVQTQQGCKGPMFLGFLGPEDTEAVRAVSKVISVFHLPHLTAQAIRSYSQFDTLEIETVDPTTNARGISMLLDEIQWKSFYMAFTPDATSSETANIILENKNLCILQSSLPIPSAAGSKNDYFAYNRLLHSLQKAESARVLIIADTSESANALLNHLESVVYKTKFIIYVKSTGILPWRLSEEISKNVLILQETSKSNILPSNFRESIEKSALWPKFLEQTKCEGACINEQVVREPTTTNMAYAMYLVHEALQTGLLLKCRARDVICPQLFSTAGLQWREHLEATTFSYRVPDTQELLKLRFHTFLPRYVSIFAHEDGTNFSDVGFISEGESLALRKRSSLPTVTETLEQQCGGNASVLPTTSTTTGPEPRPTQSMPVLVDVFGMEVNLAHFGYYELVGILTGVIVSMVAVILIMICLVYRCFRVKVDKTFSSPSTGSEAGTPPRQRKTKFNRPKFFQNSFRSTHTVRE